MADEVSLPSDLVGVREAATMVDRSTSTVRAWVRSGELEGFKQDPDKSNSPLLVSKHALLIVASSKDIEPPRPGSRQEAEEAPALLDDLVDARVEAATATARLEANEEVLGLLREKVETTEQLAGSERRRADEWKDRAEAAEARNRGLEAELAAMRAASGQSWWRRLLPAPATPALVEDQPDA